MKHRKEFTCPLEYMHDILRGKWKTVILYQLYHREVSSLADLRRDIKGISERVLIEQLADLQVYELVKKESFEGYPLRVEYSLTEDKGHRIIPALDILQELGQEYITKVGTKIE